ncbi:lysin [Paucilactobacillus vaccinostercus DSM 20634]|uniref:Lysin n=2 Tax=Paucilactobacillus vaccinostercus TaxID=176291 RepID=A0A0R2A3K5_9LACO|nr:lysin [Paucilactobacillus vaccinostercus DSM 20634]
MLNYYLPKVQTPKGSIVALDVESGTPSTSAIIYAMNKIKTAGYTPILYSGDSFIKAHLDYKAVLKVFPNSLWIARYPDYQVRSTERTQSLPVINGMSVVQFTSTYVAGGLDGNKDYLGVTDNGYDGTTTSSQGGTQVKTDSTTTAIKAGQQANNTPKTDIKAGDTVKVNLSATKWATGQKIASFVKGQHYKVAKVNGTRLLLAGVNSWINRSDAEILSVGQPVTTSTVVKATGTFKDGAYTITRQNSTFTAGQTLRVFAYPGVQATGAKYYKGESVVYDGYVRNGNYIYVSYKIKGGYHHYIAVRNANTRVPLGTFK